MVKGKVGCPAAQGQLRVNAESAPTYFHVESRWSVLFLLCFQLSYVLDENNDLKEVAAKLTKDYPEMAIIPLDIPAGS